MLDKLHALPSRAMDRRKRYDRVVPGVSKYKPCSDLSTTIQATLASSVGRGWRGSFRCAGKTRKIDRFHRSRGSTAGMNVQPGISRTRKFDRPRPPAASRPPATRDNADARLPGGMRRDQGVGLSCRPSDHETPTWVGRERAREDADMVTSIDRWRNNESGAIKSRMRRVRHGSMRPSMTQG